PALRIQGANGALYRLEYAAHPDGAGGWTRVSEFTLSEANGTYGPIVADTVAQRYYRCVRLP
ncbi:MAG TPA: hypothetical protein VMF06_13345, partial [Candidatus Limnocylindria bacterium]|nr:hypothetical protein [Candidatus Limnocylindria bacterium]